MNTILRRSAILTISFPQMPFTSRVANRATDPAFDRPVNNSVDLTVSRVVNTPAADTMAISNVTSAMKSLALQNLATFMGLPLELRWEILRLVFGSGKVLLYNSRFVKKGKVPKKGAVPPVMLTCKQVHQEGIQIYWKDRPVWLNGVTHRWEPRGKKLADEATSLHQFLPRLRNSVAAEIVHIRGQNLQRWGEMNNGRARWLLKKFPKLKTFRFHGAAHIGPFWDGNNQNQVIMECALQSCGAKFKFTKTSDIIAGFPLNPKTCGIEFQVVIVITTIIPEYHDYYLLYVNLNTGRHIFHAYEDDLEDLRLGHWDEDEALWKELRH
ncbi:hypothetical protein F5Y18DRAFT_435138 [Xylariaceae sp. FL1019]|nr:hypothetical protein F5Y18DRAFT_435138 [Xylariaceae sp. FL1019]